MSRRGFTLLELLVALAVTALAAAVAAGGLGVLGRALAREQREVSSARSLVVAHELVRGELGRALPLDWGPPGRPLVAFQGEADRLRFVNAPPVWRAGGGLELWELALEPERRGRALRVRRAALQRDGSGFARLVEAAPATLATVGPDQAFAYLEPGEGGRAGRWWPRWEGRPRLPAAVRLGGAGEGSAALVVRLAIDTPLACLSARAGGGAACR